MNQIWYCTSSCWKWQTTNKRWEQEILTDWSDILLMFVTIKIFKNWNTCYWFDRLIDIVMLMIICVTFISMTDIEMLMKDHSKFRLLLTHLNTHVQCFPTYWPWVFVSYWCKMSIIECCTGWGISHLFAIFNFFS